MNIFNEEATIENDEDLLEDNLN